MFQVSLLQRIEDILKNWHPPLTEFFLVVDQIRSYYYHE